MALEQKIIDRSKEPIASLAPRAKKASENPENGIKILNKGAFFVIRDCAKIADKYIPLMLYGMLENPIVSLQGTITKKEITTFVIQDDVESKQLKRLMILDAIDLIGLDESKDIEEPEASEVDDVYGDYGSETVYEEEKEFDYDDKEDVISLLVRALEA
jgi:hypothetical protein